MLCGPGFDGRCRFLRGKAGVQPQIAAFQHLGSGGAVQVDKARDKEPSLQVHDLRIGSDEGLDLFFQPYPHHLAVLAGDGGGVFRLRVKCT